MKVMIASPAYSGQVLIQFCVSYANTLYELKKRGIEVSSVIISSGSLLVAERNRIIEAFWKSDCTHLLFVDSDLGWPPEAVISMLEQDKEFIAGLYPIRGNSDVFNFRPEKNDNGSIVMDKHLLKMEYVPSGFILLKRSVIEKMRNKFPELYFCPKDPTKSHEASYCLFNTEVWEGEFWGEDYVFCRRAREAGVDIWVDPLIQFDHAGTLGMFVDCLINEKGEKIVQ